MAVLTTGYQLLGNTYIGNLGGEDCYIRLYGKYTEQNIANNQSYVAYRSTFYIAQSYGHVYTGPTTTKSISGSGISGASNDAQGTYYPGETTLYETGGWVTHNDAGELSVWASAGWSSGPWGASGSTSFTASLPTIPRASTPSTNQVTYDIESAPIIYLNRKVSSFNYKLEYQTDFQTAKTTIASGLQQDSYSSWTLPSTWYASMTSKSSTTVTIYETTYNGTTQIGDTKTCTFTATVPTKYKPEITGVTTSRDTLTTYLYGGAEKLLSGSTLNFTVTSTQKASATFKSLGILIGDEMFGYSTNTASITNALATTYKLHVTDSRMYQSDNWTLTYTNPYTQLTSGEPLIKRLNQTSSDVKLTVNGKYWTGNFRDGLPNQLSIKYRYKNVTDNGDWSAWSSELNDGTKVTIDTTNMTWTISDLDLGSLCDYKKVWLFQVQVMDLVYGTITASTYQPRSAIVKEYKLSAGIANFEIFQKCIRANGEVLYYWN